MNHPNRGHIKDCAAYIRRFRDRHDLTQARLADLLSSGQHPPLSEKTIQRWEAEERTPPPYLKRALRDVERELQSTIAT